MATTSGQCNLIVNYLPQSLSDQEFHQLFELIGKTTSTRIIRDKLTNYSYGYGFVNYEKPEDAAKAIEQLNGQAVLHKTIKVAYSQPSGAQTKNINLHVSGLPSNVTDKILKDEFQQFGTIIQCRVVKEKATGHCQGFAFVLFSKRDEAIAAIEGLNGKLFEGSESNVLSVKFAKTEQKGPPASFMKKLGQLNYAYKNRSLEMGAPMVAPRQEYSFIQGPSPMPSAGYYGNYYSCAGDMKRQVSLKEVTVFVYGIGPNTDERQLWQIFSPFGNISRVNVIWDHLKEEGKGYGFVTYRSFPEAASAIQNMNGSFYQGRTLQVSIKNNSASA